MNFTDPRPAQMEYFRQSIAQMEVARRDNHMGKVSWLVARGSWLLADGYWLLAVGG